MAGFEASMKKALSGPVDAAKTRDADSHRQWEQNNQRRTRERRSNVFASAVTALVVIAFFAPFYYVLSRDTARGEARNIAQDQQISQGRELAQQAADQAAAANDQLRALGLPTVAVPEPGMATDSQVITGATRAEIALQLGELAEAGEFLDAATVAGLIAREIRGAIGDGMGGVDSDAIADFAADYLQANQTLFRGLPGDAGPAGDAGPQGPPGPAPSAAEIREQIRQLVADDPSVLCPNGGTYSLLRVALANGGTADTWQCVVSVTDPTDEPRPPDPDPTAPTTTTPPPDEPGVLDPLLPG